MVRTFIKCILCVRGKSKWRQNSVVKTRHENGHQEKCPWNVKGREEEHGQNLV